MTAPATTRRAGPFTGNGATTSFPFTFKVFSTSDVAVVKADANGLETTLVLGSDYSVTLNADQDASPGGSITYPISGTALALGEKLTAIGSLPYDQTADLPTGGNYRALVVENALDRTVMQVQQVAEGLDRALTLPPTAADASAMLPIPEGGKVIAWNADGTALTNVDSTDLASVVVASTSYTNVFNGTGAQTAFTLTADPGNVNALGVSISGVVQVNGVDFTVSGTTLTFTSAPPAGTGNVVARYVVALPDGTVDATNVPYRLTAIGAATRTVAARLDGYVNVKDFTGVVGNGSNDDTAGIVAAITHCQLTLRNLYFPPGIYRISSTITLAGQPIAMIGEDHAPMQQGSTRPAVTLRWYGGASPMFNMTSGSGWGFVGMAVDNFGSATDFLVNVNGSQHMLFRNLSFLIGSGASIFSRSIFYSPTNGFGYSRWEHIHCFGAAPKFIYIDGNGASNGVTPIYIGQRSVFESNSASALTVVFAEDVNFDAILIEGNTFNQQSAANELTILDTTTLPRSTVAASVVVRDNEWDLSVGGATATHRALRLTNCRNVVVDSNVISGGGSVTAWGELVGTTVTSFDSNYAEALAGPVFNRDSTSRVYPGVNEMNASNTQGVSNDPGTGKAGGVLQVVTPTPFSTQTALTTSYVTMLSGSITPTSETSKILVIVNVNGLAVQGTSTSIQAQVTRSGTGIGEFEKEAGFAGSVTTELAVGGIGATLLDAPATVSALTYAVQVKKTGAAGALVCTSSSMVTLTLLEVAA